MRVALLSHFYPPSHTAGIEQFTHNIAQGFQAAGQDVRVLCCGSWSRGTRYFDGFVDETFQGVPVRRLRVDWTKAPAPHEYLSDSPLMAAQAEAFLTEWKPDIVHITSMYSLSTSVVHVAKGMGLPVVFTMCDFWVVCPRHTLMRADGTVCDGRVEPDTCHDCLLSESAFYRGAKAILPSTLLSPPVRMILDRPAVATRLPGFRGWGFNVPRRRHTIEEALRRVDCLMTPSSYVKSLVEGTGIARGVNVVHHGHDLEWLARYRRRVPDGAVHIGYIGQVVSIKGVHVLLEAFLGLPSATRAHLFIHGGTRDGSTPYEQQLRRQAGGSAKVHFMGPYPRTSLPEVLGNLDVIAVPSIWPDVAPLVVQEGFAAGLPVIASRIGGLPEFVGQGRGGTLIEPGDVGAWRAMLQRAVESDALLAEFRSTIPPVRTRKEEVEILLGHYRELQSIRPTA